MTQLWFFLILLDAPCSIRILWIGVKQNNIRRKFAEIHTILLVEFSFNSTRLRNYATYILVVELNVGNIL